MVSERERERQRERERDRERHREIERERERERATERNGERLKKKKKLIPRGCFHCRPDFMTLEAAMSVTVSITNIDKMSRGSPSPHGSREHKGCKQTKTKLLCEV